jgi:ABC-type antimicrobial peptide transport system permease subunit
MDALIFSWVDIIFFILAGTALGFVLGAMLMKKTMKVMLQPKPTPEEIIRDLLRIPLPDDGGESFHEECGDR